MLVLSRKKDEGILISGKDGGIRIVVIEIDKGKVRLGIEAPKGCAIFREELFMEIEGANRLSAFRDIDKLHEIIGENK